MRNKFLLGANKDNELVFCEFEIRERNGYPEFTASFDAVRPFNGKDFDALSYAENELECYDKSTLYDMCERFDCAPFELADNLADGYSDPRDAMDCSLFPECYEIDGEYWYFESSSCGQYDSRKTGMSQVVNQEAYDLIHELWDNYHFNIADSTCKAGVERVLELLKDTDEEAWIKNFIESL